MRQFITRVAAAVAAVAVLATGTAWAQSRFRLYEGNTHTFTAMVYEGQPVRIEVRGDGDSRADLDLYVYDRYGRLVAVCYAGDDDLNAMMVRDGWALAYRRYGKDYVSQETQARAAGAGLWQGNFVEPWEWRKQSREASAEARR